MFDLFWGGNILWMSVLTIELIAILLAAWKAPNWVKELGQLALITAPMAFFTGFYQAAGVVVVAGDISTSLLWGGFRSTFISIIYGLLIFALSLVIRIIQKPRIP